MKKSTIYRLTVCLGIAALSVICVACSIKAGNTDPDHTRAVETSVAETETTEETTPETTKKKVKETKPTEKETVETTDKEPTERTTSPTTQESTAAITTDASEAFGGAEITPSAKRVYPITEEDAIALFDALGLTGTERISDLEYVEKIIEAVDPSKTYQFGYYKIENKESAQVCLDSFQRQFAKDKNGEPFEGTCEITEEDGYSKLVVCGEYKSGDPIYLVGICVDDVIVIGIVLSTEDCYKEGIDYGFSLLGYM